MKKILIGLLAMSALSYAAPIQVTNPANPDSSIFNPVLSQEGKITLKASITSNIETVKYIVFANTTDSIDGAKDELTLTDFVIKAEAGAVPSDAGFTGANSTLYIKKVSGTNTLETLQDQDRLSVSIYQPVNNIYYEFINENTLSFKPGNVWITPLILITSQQRDEIIAKTGLIANGSFLLKTDADEGIAIKGIALGMQTKGEITFSNTSADVTTNGMGKPVVTNPDIISKWNEFFAQGVAFDTHLRIIVR